jgi:hypothetical protein
VSCKGCPFLYEAGEKRFGAETWIGCNLKYSIFVSTNALSIGSPDCQLEIVQYTLKDKPESIVFRPKENE